MSSKSRFSTVLSHQLTVSGSPPCINIGGSLRVLRPKEAPGIARPEAPIVETIPSCEIVRQRGPLGSGGTKNKLIA